jgi:CDP-diacylglycerol--serine O-phosphatidyltransferase
MEKETQKNPVSGNTRKKRRRKYIAVLPSFITLMNGVCGFFAIIQSSRSPALRWSPSFIRGDGMSPFTMAGVLIFLAMVADMLDGRVARLTRTTSSFGGQLDSLSDAISFGIAPAFLMVKLVEFHLAYIRFESRQLSVLLERGIIFSAVFYAMCAVVRLARFNVENDEDESAHMNFAGIPSPAAAGVVTSLIVLHQQIISRTAFETSRFHHFFNEITVFSLPVITLLTGILMVSRIRYPHLANQLFRGKKTLPVFIGIFAVGLFSVWNIQLVLTLGFCGFAVFGVARWIVVSIFKKRPNT